MARRAKRAEHTLVEQVEREVEELTQRAVDQIHELRDAQGTRPLFTKTLPPNRQAELFLGDWAVRGHAHPSIGLPYWDERFADAQEDPEVDPFADVVDFHTRMRKLWTDPEKVKIALESLPPELVNLYAQMRADGRHPGFPPTLALPPRPPAATAEDVSRETPAPETADVSRETVPAQGGY